MREIKEMFVEMSPVLIFSFIFLLFVMVFAIIGAFTPSCEPVGNYRGTDGKNCIKHIDRLVCVFTLKK